MLQPIVASYEERYGCRLFTESNDDQIISDDIKDDGICSYQEKSHSQKMIY